MAPLLTAGGTFAGAVALGILGGIGLSNRTHQPAWVLGGLFAGLAVGGFVVVRAFLRAA
jgi:hypothetical protein